MSFVYSLNVNGKSKELSSPILVFFFSFFYSNTIDSLQNSCSTLNLTKFDWNVRNMSEFPCKIDNVQKHPLGFNASYIFCNEFQRNDKHTSSQSFA